MLLTTPQSRVECQLPKAYLGVFSFLQPRADQDYSRSPEFHEISQSPGSEYMRLDVPQIRYSGIAGLSAFKLIAFSSFPFYTVRLRVSSVSRIQIEWSDSVLFFEKTGKLEPCRCSPSMFTCWIRMVPSIQKYTLLSTDIEVLGAIGSGWIILAFR
jgi:hypothetical protein